MAQVVSARIKLSIEDYLTYLTRKWSALPEVAAEWDSWDEGSRSSFVLDWGVPADRLGQLHAWAAAGFLTGDQQRRLDDLTALVARHQSLLDQLLSED